MALNSCTFVYILSNKGARGLMEKIFISKTIVYEKNKKGNEHEYYRNSKQLKENDSPIEDEEFSEMIRDAVGGFYEHCDNIVLLIGAGGSVVENCDKRFGHTVNMLLEAVEKKLKRTKSCCSLDELCSMSRYKKPENQGINLEDLISNIQLSREFISDKDKSRFEKAYQAILELIKNKTSYDYKHNIFGHAAIINGLSNLLSGPNRLSVVTTNYDTVIEDCANSIGYTVFDGFTFSSEPKFDADMFEWDLTKNVMNVESKERIYKKTAINLLKIHGSLTWERKGNEVIRRSKKDVKDPIMVFPSSNKYMQSYDSPYFELFTKFQELLRKPNTVIITSGFSFADNHISRMIIQAIKTCPSLSLLITDYNISPDCPNDNWNELTNLMESNYSIAYLKASMNSDLPKYIGEIDNDK